MSKLKLKSAPKMVPPEAASHLKKYLWKAGQSGNPNGRPKGSRGKLTEDFMVAIHTDFKKHGESAIQNCRVVDPASYLRIIAAMLPKHFLIERPLDGMSDEELSDILLDIRGRINNANQMIDVTPSLMDISGENEGDNEGDDESD